MTHPTLPLVQRICFALFAVLAFGHGYMLAGKRRD